MVLDRYILRLWFAPFFVSLSIAIGVLLLGRALKVIGLIAENGVDWSVMFLMLAAILPYFLVLTVPMAAFFAMQSVMVRLQQGSELDAFRAAGVSYPRLFRSVFGISVVLWLALSFTAMQWMPQGQKAFQGFIYAIQQAKSAPSFDPQRFNRDMEDFTIYVDGTDAEGHLNGFMLEDDRPGGPVVYLAEQAEIKRAGNQLHFDLYKGTRLEGGGDSLRALQFERYHVAIDAGQMGMLKLPNVQGNVMEMGMLKLWQQRKAHDTPEATGEWHRRLLLPTTVLVLLLFALPLSLEPKRSGKAGAYMLGIAVLLAVYNVQITLHQQVASGHLPWWSMWAGQLLMAAVGFELSRRAAQDRLPSLLGWFGELAYAFHARFIAGMARRWTR
jgi:LPS export ABC transporter permease LptF